MSIDYIISRFSSDSLSKNGLTPENLSQRIKKDFLHIQGSDTLYVMLPSWSGTLELLAPTKKFVTESRKSYLAYQFPVEILSDDYQLTKDCFDLINQLVRTEIADLKNKYSFSRCIINGKSLGSVNATMIANNNKDIDEVVLLTAANCLAESVWTGCRTIHLRKSYQQQGIDLEKLKELWFTLAPENNLNFINKKVSLYLSEADDVIPYNLGQILVQKMKAVGLKLDLRTNKYLGHYLTLIYSYLFPKRFIKLSNKKIA